MKLLIILFFLFPVSNLLGGDFSLSTEFSWEKVEKKKPWIIKKFIAAYPQEFWCYRQNESFTPLPEDLMKDLHVVDINNDQKFDIIYDGYTCGEQTEISIFLNDGGTFKKIFTDYQEILKLEFTNGILSAINIKDPGCCEEFTVTNRFYTVTYSAGNFEFILKNSYRYVENTKLPDLYWPNSKTVKILNNNYNLRASPLVDAATEYEIYGEPTKGNMVGRIPKDALAIAMADSTDETGRVWFFVAVLPEFPLKDTYLYDLEGAEKSYKCGWISSRFLEVVE